MYGWGFRPYVSVAKRRANALREVNKLGKKGQVISPVKLGGRKIASTFWGKAWCDNLEAYSDFASRLPRGRTYVRNGSVVDLQIKAGSITALVSGSELYRVKITIKPLCDASWDCIRQNCAGKIASVIELLKGSISDHVMRIVTDQSTGLFPSPKEIEMNCSCPDWAGMCKHVAATLYGVGARLDQQPDLLFSLRKVDHLDLVARAADIEALASGATGGKTIDTANLGDVFGIELEDLPATASIAAPQSSNKVKRLVKSSDIAKEPSPARYDQQFAKTTGDTNVTSEKRPRKQLAAKSIVVKRKSVPARRREQSRA